MAGVAAAAFVLTADTCNQGINTQPASGGNSSTGSNSSSSSAAVVAHVGNSLVLHGNGNGEQVTMSVVKVVDPAQGADQFAVPDQGKHFVAIQLRVMNSGTTAYHDSFVFECKVLDAQGQSFSADLSDTNAGPSFANGGVDEVPGATELGFLTFQVPDGDKPAKFQLTIDSGLAETGEWLIP